MVLFTYCFKTPYVIISIDVLILEYKLDFFVYTLFKAYTYTKR